MSRKYDHHAAGQQDFKRHQYRPPTVSFADVFGQQIFGNGAVRRKEKDRAAYDAGHRHASKNRGGW